MDREQWNDNRVEELTLRRRLGIDLGKMTFHLVALDEHGKIVVRKKFSRTQLLVFTAKLEITVIGMEVCAGAHFLDTALGNQEHEVRLIPAQFVKPFRKSNKTISSMPRRSPTVFNYPGSGQIQFKPSAH